MVIPRKYSKLSIISFILLISSFFIKLLSSILFRSLSFLTYLVLPTSLVLAIISLVQIKKHNLKGKWLAILTIVLGGLSIIITILAFVFILLLLNSGTEYYSMVRLNTDISAENLKLIPLEDYSGEADMFILTNNITSEIPDNCIIKYFSLMYSQDIFKISDNSTTAGQTILRGTSYRSGVGTKNYPSETKHSQKLFLREDETIFGPKRNTIKSLLDNKGDLRMDYTITPFLDDRNNYAPNGDFICSMLDYPEKYSLDLTGNINKEIVLNPKKIICLKQYIPQDKNTYKTTEDCKFFQVSSDIEIKFNLDPESWEKESYQAPIF